MGMSLDLVNRDGMGCLFWAVAGYDRLQKRVCCVDFAKRHREEMVRLLISEGVRFDRRSLQRAILCGDVEMVELLLSLGCPIVFQDSIQWNASMLRFLYSSN